MCRYRYAITIIQDEDDRCTKVFTARSSTKQGFIKDYIEAMALLHKLPANQAELDANRTAEAAQEALL